MKCDGKLTETGGNPADAFTKPLSLHDFQAYFRFINNVAAREWAASDAGLAAAAAAEEMPWPRLPHIEQGVIDAATRFDEDA